MPQWNGLTLLSVYGAVWRAPESTENNQDFSRVAKSYANSLPDAEQLFSEISSNGKQGQFDQIYTYTKDGETRILIIEAKGGSGTLTSRKLSEKTKRAQ